MSSSLVSSRLVDLLVVVGPSGSGKTTLIRRLMKEFPAHFGYSISHTTRAMRTGEVNGKSYHFVPADNFDALAKDGKFLEYATVHNTRYGTSEMSVDDVLAKDQVAAMDLDIKGAKNLRGHRRFRSLVLFVQPPTFAELEHRLRDRNTESEDKILTRLESARKELLWHENNTAFFDASIVNDDLDACYLEFRARVMDGAFKGGADAAHDVAAFEDNAHSR